MDSHQEVAEVDSLLAVEVAVDSQIEEEEEVEVVVDLEDLQEAGLEEAIEVVTVDIMPVLLM